MKLSGDDLSVAAMRAMWPIPAASRIFPKERDIAIAKARTAKWREWAETADLDDRTRTAYLGWVEFCEQRNAEAEHELNTGENRKRHEEWKRRNAEQSARVTQISIPKPAERF